MAASVSSVKCAVNDLRYEIIAFGRADEPLKALALVRAHRVQEADSKPMLSSYPSRGDRPLRPRRRGRRGRALPGNQSDAEVGASGRGPLDLPHTGHTINLEEPAAVNAQVESFLSAVERGCWRRGYPMIRGGDRDAAAGAGTNSPVMLRRLG
jgi:hypothetical protein